MLARRSVDRWGKPRNGLPQRGSLGPYSAEEGGVRQTIVWRMVCQRNQRIDRPLLMYSTSMALEERIEALPESAFDLVRSHCGRPRIRADMGVLALGPFSPPTAAERLSKTAIPSRK